MTKRKVLLTVALFGLLVMMFAFTVFAANNTSVKVTVKTSVGTRELTTTVGQVFTTTAASTGTGYTITGIKGFGGYTVSAIKAIHIPYDATEVNITAANTYIESIVIDNYCQTKITSVAGLSNLKKISIGSSADVTFKSGCTVESFEELTVTGKNSTVTCDSNSFKDRTLLKTLNFGENNTFKFGANCFQNIGITELNLNDESTFTFTGAGSFYGCVNLKNIYAGDGVLEIKNTPFDNCGALEMVFVKAATSILDNSFRAGSSGSTASQCQLKVYVHTLKPVTFGSNAFANRNSYGVVVCALSPNVTSFSNCKYELHYGLQHAYTPASDVPTCYNSYTTDCPCGKVTNAKYKLYVSGKNVQIVDILTGANPDIPHDFSDTYMMEYANGIDNVGEVELKCSVCGNREDVVRVAPALVSFAGYSVSETGNGAMVIGIRFNSVTIAQYENYIDEKIDFGVVLSSVSVLNGANPLKDNGYVYADKTVYKHDMSGLGYYDSTLKISGISSTLYDKEFVLSGYIKLGDEILYIDNGGVNGSVTAVTYNQLLN